MKFYFAGSIRGGREKALWYEELIMFLGGHGEVLTEHIGSRELSSYGESTGTDEDIYTRDVSWIDEADVVVADVSVTSLGVGYEIGYAEAKGKSIICLYQKEEGKRLSAMIAGNKKVILIEYKNGDEAKELLAKELEKLN